MPLIVGGAQQFLCVLWLCVLSLNFVNITLYIVIDIELASTHCRSTTIVNRFVIISKKR